MAVEPCSDGALVAVGFCGSLDGGGSSVASFGPCGCGRATVGPHGKALQTAEGPHRLGLGGSGGASRQGLGLGGDGA